MEGNGNNSLGAFVICVITESERTFPVEGNGNINFVAVSIAPSDKSERTFPLEGNGNLLAATYHRAIASSVRKDFPGGRVLKLPFVVSEMLSDIVLKSERTFPLEGY